MNTKKMSNLVRMIALFLTAVILTCTFGFTVDGWAIKDNPHGEIPPQYNETVPGDNTTEIPEEPEVILPKYINRLTGLETSEELSCKAAISYIMDKSAPCYGISGAEIIIDIPTEAGNRLVCIRTDNESLWKIGSLSPTRGYISNISSFFKTNIVSLGRDDVLNYESCPNNRNHYDLSSMQNKYYTEYSNFTYTNSDLIRDFISDDVLTYDAPYIFAEFDTEIRFEDVATKIFLDETTELIFDENTKNYSWYEDGEAKRDLINGKAVSFTNCLVLFADSVIYDNSNGCQMVMDTIGSGHGYYFTNGSMTEINWSATADGVMSLYSSTGDKLTINRGQIYIRYAKSSQKNSITIQ